MLIDESVCELEQINVFTHFLITLTKVWWAHTKSNYIK